MNRVISPQLWQQMAEMGWLGVVIPEKYGGTGGSFLDLVVLEEELGRVLAPIPFFSTVISGLLLEGGSQSQKEKYFSPLANGDLILSLALIEPELPDAVKILAQKDGENYRLNDTKLFVNHAHIADYLICIVRTGESIEEGITLFLVNAKYPGIKCTLLKNITGDKLFEVEFNNVTVSKSDIIGEENGS